MSYLTVDGSLFKSGMIGRTYSSFIRSMEGGRGVKVKEDKSSIIQVYLQTNNEEKEYNNIQNSTVQW